MEIVNAFKTQIQEGPHYICIVCNRCLYRRSISQFRYDSYKDLNENILFCVDSHDGEFYICLICDRKFKKNVIPCQAVANKIAAEGLPSLFQTIRRLKRVLVLRRILFKKVTRMPNGQPRKLKGSISEVDRNCRSLPRPADSKGLIELKLKHKAEYRSHS